MKIEKVLRSIRNQGNLMTADQSIRLDRLKHAATSFCLVVDAETSGSAEQTTAIRKIQESLFYAMLAIESEASEKKDHGKGKR